MDGNGGGLIAASSNQATSNGGSVGAPWGCTTVQIPGASGQAIGTGMQNTIDIEAGCTTPGIAADICANLTLNGYSDWFLPSRYEMQEMYLNKNIIGSFGNNFYWTSTESGNSYAYLVQFSNGYEWQLNKNNSESVRAIRAF